MPKPPIQLKRSGTASATPSSLEHGELALNYADSKVFWKNASNTISSFTFQSYALASHSHSASAITSGLIDSARLPQATTIAAGAVIVGTGLVMSGGTMSINSTGVSAGSYGSASSVATFTVGADGRLTAAGSTSIAIAASAITSGTLDAARLPLATTLAAGAVIVGTGLGVSSGTVSVTYGTSAGTACQGNDSRLSDARTPTSHSHGNITNAGAIGSTANLPIITTTSGVLTTGTFSTTAGTFCEGNDPRLSDTRTPTDGSVTTAKIANDAVTYAKLQNVSATDRLLGRSSAGSGDVEEISCGSFGRSLIGSADAAAARTTLSVQPTASPAFTGGPSIINSGASDNATIRYGNSGKNWYVGLRGDTSNVFAVTDDVTFRFQINTSGVITCFGQLLVTTGSASACGVAFSGDTDTGIAQLSAAGANTLSICTGGGERVRVDASGNVGIGGAPFYALDVQRTSANAILNVQTTTSGNAQLRIECVGNASSTITQNRTSNNLEITNGSSGSIVFTNNGSDRVRVDASGNVGIGVTPAASTTSNVQASGDITLYGASRSFLGNLYFQSGWKYAGTGHGWGWIEGSGNVDFARTSSSGTAGNTATLTTAIRINSGSEVLIGTTTDNGAYLLQVNSQIYATNATIATSDARFKTNVESLNDATAVIEALRPVAFDFIQHAERNFAAERQVGLIAQEAQSALAGTDYADSVVAQCGDHLGLAYEKLVPVLIKALQESNARIAALEERNHA